MNRLVDVSNVTQVVEGGVTTTYTYDNIDQLTGESRTGYSATYTYDANGNRLTKTVNGTTETYAYDNGDKLTSAGGKTYTYDAAGRTTAVTVGGVSTNLTYDYESRVTQISRSGLTTNTFTYNGLDTRVSKVDSAGTANFRRAGAYVTDPVLGDGGGWLGPKELSPARNSCPGCHGCEAPWTNLGSGCHRRGDLSYSYDGKWNNCKRHSHRGQPVAAAVLERKSPGPTSRPPVRLGEVPFDKFQNWLGGRGS